MAESEEQQPVPWSTRLCELCRAFPALSLTSFGGPQAHIALFYTEFVNKRAWLSDAMFAELFAIAQSLPGPASTQLGVAIGLLRGDWVGGIITFIIWRQFPLLLHIVDEC